VDVIFLLLIFFIITSDILPLKSLNVENPTLDKSSQAMTTQLMVVMDAHNVIYLGHQKEIIDLVSVKERVIQELAQIKTAEPTADPTVVLNIDRRVEYGTFLRLFSTVQECGQKVRLVYKTESAVLADAVGTPPF
jgi:biopolymer transport protein ExbD